MLILVELSGPAGLDSACNSDGMTWSPDHDDLPLRNPRPSHYRLAATYSMVHVMSEVKRYWVDLDDGTYPAQMHGCNDEVVKASDFDAQRLRADTAEARVKTAEHDLEFFKAGKNEQFDRAEVAEQCIAALSSLLREGIEAVERLSTTPKEHNEEQWVDLHAWTFNVDAALNPNPEGHYSDCATNNRGVPELLGPCDCGYEGKQK